MGAAARILEEAHERHAAWARAQRMVDEHLAAEAERCGPAGNPFERGPLRSRALSMVRMGGRKGAVLPNDFTYIVNSADKSANTGTNPIDLATNIEVFAGSITKSGSNGVYTWGSIIGTPTANLIGQYIEIAGAPSAGNNGRFPITAQTGTTVTYTNAAAVSEATPSQQGQSFGCAGTINGSLGTTNAFANATTANAMRIDPTAFNGTYVGAKLATWRPSTVTVPYHFSNVGATLNQYGGSSVLTSFGAYVKCEDAVASELFAVSTTSSNTGSGTVQGRIQANHEPLLRRNNGTQTDYDSNVVIDSNWHLMVWVMPTGGANQELWIDGVLQATLTNTSQTPSPSFARFGSPSPSGGLARWLGTFGVPRRMTASEMLATKAWYEASVA